jgi:RHS repeat-associated protein
MQGDFWNTSTLSDSVDTPTDYFTYDPQGNTCQRLRSMYDFWQQNDGSPGVTQRGPWLLDTQEYDAFGDQISDIDGVYQTQSQAMLASDYGYEGQFGYRTDQYSGLVLAGHRFYQPQTGRWLNRDPIGYQGGMNLYEYAGDDPVNEVDTSGDDGSGTMDPKDPTQEYMSDIDAGHVARIQTADDGFRPSTPTGQDAQALIKGNKEVMTTAEIAAPVPEASSAEESYVVY